MKPSWQLYFEKARHHRHRIIAGAVIALLLLIIGFETFVILEQKRVNQRIEAQSEEALGKFMKQGKTASGAGGTAIMFRNVQFCWSRRICIDTRQLTATAVPLSHGQYVVFDDLKSFIVKVHNASVLISPQTLQGMFNESVFNYPGSNLRNLSVGIQKSGSENHIKLTGSLKFFLWIPFAMDTNLSVDRRTNTLVISVNTLKVFGFIPATWLISLKPFNLDKLLTLPPNRYLTVHHNLMMVKPFGLFPPPRIDGQMSAIAVTPTLIQLQFSGADPGFGHIPEAGTPNYIYLQNGNAQFGRIRMLDTQVQVIDRNAGDRFRFSLLNYLHYLPLSDVKLLEDGGAVLHMPDHGNLPDMGAGVAHPQNDAGLQEKSTDQSEKSGQKRAEKPGFWGNVKAKLKRWFGI